ncbi:MAG TPA: YHS domain-containing (seleno)protein [Pyrinomonadaceae bacterium]|nr:YHS domain-containing (seleno)protein [Pyrinomonadaceae bacterium]
MKARKTLPVVALIIAIAAAVGAFSMMRAQGVQPVNKTAAGLALRGYDAVAYFREGRAVEGRAEFEHSWNGARWLFASGSNRDAFAREPEAFAPQYGGYCSYAVAHGYTADGDPLAWKVMGGKLYLNYSVEVRQIWEQDITGHVRRGDLNWPRFLEHKPEHKG